MNQLSGDGKRLADFDIAPTVSVMIDKERIKERLSLWLECPVTTRNITVFDIETLRTMVELANEVT